MPIQRRKEYKPRLIFWEVTKGCNLRCIHCRATATELMSPTDLPTSKALDIISQIADFANPILVLSGGEPLYRPDIFAAGRICHQPRPAHRAGDQRNAGDEGRRARRSRNPASSAFRSRWTAPTRRRTTPSAASPARSMRPFTACAICSRSACRCRSTLTIARHNAHQLPDVLELARNLGADALHTFLLVPVGCGVDIAAEQMVSPEEYERMLNWFYDQSLEGDIELKATCAPHYFRVVRQRRAADRLAGREQPAARPTATRRNWPDGHDDAGLDRNLPEAERRAAGGTHGTSRRPSGDMNAMTKGCLAGTGVCFISHEGEVFPCGYLPALAGDLRKQSFAEIWNDSVVFEPAARRRQPEGQVRLLRVPPRLHGMPRARIRRHRRLSGRRTVLRLRARHLKPDDSRIEPLASRSAET